MLPVTVKSKHDESVSAQQYQNLARQPLVIDKAYLRREERAVTKIARRKLSSDV